MKGMAVLLVLCKIGFEMSSLYDSDMSNSEILLNKAFRWKVFCLDYDLINSKPKKIHQIAINWEEVKFQKTNKADVPPEQGIYMFVLNISNGLNLNGSSKFVLYVGQTVDLRSRFESYFGYENSDEPSDFLKRSMVLIWKGKLDFYFFKTNGLTPKDLTKVEFDLIDLIIPPINLRFRGKVLKKKIKLYAPR